MNGLQENDRCNTLLRCKHVQSEESDEPARALRAAPTASAQSAAIRLHSILAGTDVCNAQQAAEPLAKQAFACCSGALVQGTHQAACPCPADAFKHLRVIDNMRAMYCIFCIPGEYNVLIV